jgi:hypothetical protein
LTDDATEATLLVNEAANSGIDNAIIMARDEIFIVLSLIWSGSSLRNLSRSGRVLSDTRQLTTLDHLPCMAQSDPICFLIPHHSLQIHNRYPLNSTSILI